jgi:hypothetical protein
MGNLEDANQVGQTACNKKEQQNAKDNAEL